MFGMISCLASGYCKPGEVLAIMGASGAGKSTLLNALTYRNLSGVRVSRQLLKLFFNWSHPASTCYFEFVLSVMFVGRYKNTSY